MKNKTAISQVKREEPWVELATGSDLVNWGKQDEVTYNQQIRQREKHKMFQLCFDMIKENAILGDYYEFGCHRVRTFRMALTEARRKNLDGMKFFAFDSFEGLPMGKNETGVENWEGGALMTSEKDFLELIKKHGIYVDKVSTVKGFFEDSLSNELKNRLSAEGSKISLVTIDCDYYESAVPIFSFIELFLQKGSIIYIDDYFAGYKGAPDKGVSLAFSEFYQKCSYKFADHLNVGWAGKTFITY